MLKFLVFILLFLAVPAFAVFLQTVKNIIFFGVIVSFTCLAFILDFNLAFLPIFLMLINVGAVVVATLFLVLTFDLRAEYVKKVFSNKALFNIFIYYAVSPLWVFGALHISTNYAPTLTEADRIAAYEHCLNCGDLTKVFCDRNFGAHSFGKGLYGATKQHLYEHDINIISNHLYTDYWLLFIILGILLTFALISAVIIMRRK